MIVSTALTDRGEVALRIRDTGIGMTEKEIETALKPSARCDHRPRRAGAPASACRSPRRWSRPTAPRFTIDSAPNQGTLVKITFPTTRVLAG